MPIRMSRIESRIYLFRWIGQVMVEDAQESIAQAIQTIEEAGEVPFIGIHDLKIGKLPMDIRGFSQMINATKDDVAFSILVNSPPAASTIIKALQVFAPSLQNLRICNTMDEAIVAAQSVLKALNYKSRQGD